LTGATRPAIINPVMLRSKLMVISEKRDCFFDPKATPLKVLFHSINQQKNLIKGNIVI